jgi:hypothetical protein
MASMFGSMMVLGGALADSGETLTGVTGVTPSSCQQLRAQFGSPPFGGDVLFACYGNETTNPACGLFSTAGAPGQTNALGFCQDSFPDAVSVVDDPPLKTNIRILATAHGHTTGIAGVLASNATSPSNVICLDFADGGGPPDQEVCIKIDPRSGSSAPSVSQCPAGEQFFRIVDASSCSVLQGVVNATAGAAAGTVAFGLFTDVFDTAGSDVNGVTLGEPLSQGLLVCPTHRASCVAPTLADQLANDFPNGVRVRYQIPIAALNEQPDCYLYRGRRIC